MSDAAIEFHGVSKRYPFFALENISFRLEKGQIMGLVGPNGAGKTTAIHILMGLIRPDAGEVEMLNCAIPRDQVRAKWDVGFVSEEMRLFAGVTLAWHMDFVRSIYPNWDEGYARTLLKRFFLRPEQKTKGLSRGEHVKAMLLLALARRPRLLVLDEPTAGLDPVARHEVIAELMEVLLDDDRSILFSSHNTLDVEQISDAITFIDRGRLVESDDKESFVERWRRVTVEGAPAGLPNLPGIVDITGSGHRAVITTNAWREHMFAPWEHAGARVHEIQRMSLEEIFVATVMYKRKERGE